MRLLLINPNSNLETTARMKRVAASALEGTGVEIEAVSADSRIPAIETPEQSDIAAKAVVACIADRTAGYDVAIVAAFSDPGLTEARQLAPYPVIGIAESAMLAAAELGPRFSIITLGATFRDLIAGMATAYGVGPKLANLRFLPWRVADVGADQARYIEDFRSECWRAIEEDGAAALIIGGGPLSGIANQIAPTLPVPILDGVVCAARRAADLAGTRG